MSSRAEVEKKARVEDLMTNQGFNFVHFKGADLMSGPGTNGFIKFDSRRFAALVQREYPGTTDNMTNDFAKTIKVIAPDWSHTDRYIAFYDRVWDMVTLDWAPDQLEYVYSSRIKPNSNTAPAWKFLTELSMGDEALAHDYLQAMAPLGMYRKPTGVVWFIGDGANGKSSLINALYRIFGPHLASLTTSAIEDGKAAPSLTGILGNIVREASEARVEDTERYKAIGTHEAFSVRQLYTQDNIIIETNFHTIFNANNIPVFSDKTKGARRRTLVVPFKAHFADNPSFEDETFTDEFLGGLLTLILEETKVIRDNGYRYKWSDATLRAKEAYDSEVNSAEAFIDYLSQSSVAGFTNYAVLKINYEVWCGHQGLVPLGITTLKRTMTTAVNPTKKSVRDGKIVYSRYFFIDALDDDLVWLENGYGVLQPKEIEAKQPVPETERLSEEW